MTRFWLRAIDRSAREDAGFSMVEVMISLLIIGIVAAASAGFFVSNIKDVNSQRQHQEAVYLTNQQVETVQSLPVADLVQGRTHAAVTALFATTAATALNISGQDDTSNAGDYDSSGTTTTPTVQPQFSQTINGISYTLYTFIDVCWFAVTTGTCGSTQATGTVKEYRVSVYTAWTAAGPCVHGCNYSSSTLIDPTADPTFNTNISQPALLTGPTPGTINNGNAYDTSSNGLCTTATGSTTGATEVILTATNLVSGVRVWIASGGGTISQISQPSSSEVDFCLQAGDQPGTYTLSVINPDGGHFQTSITEVPNIYQAAGWNPTGKVLTLSGGGFESGATVTASNGATIGSVSGPVAGSNAWDTITLNNFSGTSAGGSTTLTLTNPDGSSDTYSITSPAKSSYVTVPQAVTNGAWVLGQTTGLTLTGTGLTSGTGAVVTSGSGTATFTDSSATLGTLALVGPAAGTETVQLYNANGGKSATFNITVDAAPAVTSESPTSIGAATTTSVTVNGTGFQTGISATDTGTGSISVTSVTATRVVLSVNSTPTNSDSITLTNPDGGNVTFSIGVVPTITNFAITSGTLRHSTATSWTITGTGFVTTGTTTVTLKEGSTTLAVSTVRALSTTSITFNATTTSSTGSQTFVVTVTNPDGSSATFTKALTLV